MDRLDPTMALAPTSQAERAEAIEQRLKLPLLVATLLVIPVMILQASDVPDTWTLVDYIGNWAIWLTFWPRSC